jgi:hypothetical protein
MVIIISLARFVMNVPPFEVRSEDIAYVGERKAGASVDRDSTDVCGP